MTLRKSIREKIGQWSRKGKAKRTKEMWHVPKRSSLGQTREIIKILVDLNLDNKTWNRNNQENVNRELARRGFTQSGTMLTPTAFGTLIALVKYFGYIFVKDKVITVTKAGKAFLKDSIDQFREQLFKFQITNPLITRYCRNILVFPFKETLKLLLKLKYLTRNELGYIVFMNFKKHEDFNPVARRVLEFRNLPEKIKKKKIKEFKDTSEGNVALVKAPSVNYFISFLHQADLCEKIKIKGKRAIKPKNKTRIKALLKKYKKAYPFNFQDDLTLWIGYIGAPTRLNPPRKRIIRLKNPREKNKLILIYQNSEIIEGGLINAVKEIEVPLFDNEKYLIKVFELRKGTNIGSFDIVCNEHKREVIIDLKKTKRPKPFSKKDWARLIKEHIESPDFDKEYKNLLRTLQKVLKIKINKKRIRGGRFEFLLYKFLQQLQKEGLVKHLNWNGEIKKFGIANPATGGRTGLPDITFSIENIDFVLELTTIKSRSTQWSAEGSSVPDHIRNFKKQKKKKWVVGLFCAPIQFQRNVKALKSGLKDDGIPILCYDVDTLISVFLSKDPLKRLRKRLS